jgi:hypothetical protein
MDDEYALTWTAPGGKPVGPVKTVTALAHKAAREMVDLGGGTVQVLRAAGSGWREVARYTAGGAHSSR